MSYKITNITVSGLRESDCMGLDIEKPVFAWQFKSNVYNMRQEKVRINVGTEKSFKNFWDSGWIETDCSTGIVYEGKPLLPCSIYFVKIETVNQNNEVAAGYIKFETGFLNPDINAWADENGVAAKWLGAPEYYVCSDRMGVFSIRSNIEIKDGKSAGIIFGANDKRLLNKELNESLLEGKNYICYKIDYELYKLEIYRVGYSKDDSEDVPFAVIEISHILNEKNKQKKHELRIDVIGNRAFAYIDDILADGELNEQGEPVKPRQLNPLADNDITTFPRLCDIGYYVGKHTEAYFDGISLNFIRMPCNKFRQMETITLKAGDKAITQIISPDCHSIPMLRCDFSVKKPIKQARLYATARGIYDCRINGKAISNQFFAPGASHFDKHLMYQTYDISDFLKQGGNGISVVLSSGWWNGSQTFSMENYNFWGDKESLLAKIIISYTDGTSDIYVTDKKNWKYYGEGPYIFAGFFQGEHFDAARKHIYDDFSMPNYKIDGMKEAAVIDTDVIDEFNPAPGFFLTWPKVNETQPLLKGSYNAPVYAVEEFTAKKMFQPAENVYIYDLEQEIAGVPVLKLKGTKGQIVRIRHAEMLYPDLPEYFGLKNKILQVNLRDASATDIYIMNGDEDGEIYQPKFTFHGYRYIEISGLDYAPALEDVRSLQLSSISKITGDIKTDNELVNRLTQNVKYSQLCNFISIPTDCPQRNERMGWTGDAHIFVRTATYQADVRTFYKRYLEAIKDGQLPDGNLPNIAPIGGGFGGITYGSAMHIIIWEVMR